MAIGIPGRGFTVSLNILTEELASTLMIELDLDILKLVKHATNTNLLDSLRSLEVYNNRNNTMNSDKTKLQH